MVCMLAKLAGVPKLVIERAKILLAEYSKDERFIYTRDKSLENNNEGRQTSLKIDQMVLDMQSFLWEEKQTKSLSIQNTGSIPLVINDVTTSCGCTVVDYPKQPILPGKSDTLHISYQAEHPGHFNKTISIYCNTTSSPILIKIKGNAEK